MEDTTPARLPGLSKLTEAELRAQYAKELGQDVPEDLTTTAQLREAISKHREDASVIAALPEATEAAAPAGLVAGAGEVLAEKDGEQRVFTVEAWATLSANRYGWKEVADTTPKPPMI